MKELQIQRYRTGRLLCLLLVIWLSTLACMTAGRMTGPENTRNTAQVRTSTAQARQNAWAEIGQLATMTALVSQPDDEPTPSFTNHPGLTPVPATANPYSPSPTRTPRAFSKLIRFVPGGTSAFFYEIIGDGDSHIYRLSAQEGQTLILTAISPTNDVFLDVLGEDDGNRLVWEANAISYWFGILPKTQMYQITVTTNNPETSYFLTVEIPANIEFETGTTSVSIDGYIDAQAVPSPDMMPRVRYLVRGSAGQTLTVHLDSPDLDQLSMGILGQKDGQAYLRYQVKNNGGTLKLPSTQGYYLDVYAQPGQSASFTLDITLR